MLFLTLLSLDLFEQFTDALMIFLQKLERVHGGSFLKG